MGLFSSVTGGLLDRSPFCKPAVNSKSNPLVKYVADDKLENEDDANLKVRVDTIENIPNQPIKLVAGLGLLVADEIGAIELTTTNKRKK